MMEPRHANSSAYTCCPLLHRNSKTKPFSTVTMDWRYAKQRLNKSKKRTRGQRDFQSKWPENHHRSKQENHKLSRRTLHLASESYKPFMKPNNRILYVHQERNHPLLPPPPLPRTTGKTSRKTSINDWPASHLARKFSTTRSHRTRKRLTRAATTTSSHTTHSQRATEIAKEKSYGTIPHGTLT